MTIVVTHDGTRLYATERGRGPAVILVHGWKASGRIWDRTVVALERDFRVVTYDLRGMGASEKPATSWVQ